MKRGKVLGSVVIAFCLFVFAGPASAIPQYAIEEFGTLGGRLSWAFGINDSGQVVGTASDKNETWHPVIFGTGSPTSLGEEGIAWGINNLGHVVGRIRQNAFFFNGSVQHIGPVGYAAYAINDNDAIVAQPLQGGSPFLYHAGTTTWLPFHGQAISNDGTVVGARANPFGGGSYAGMWKEGVLFNIPFGGAWTQAFDINQEGDVLGGTYSPGSGVTSLAIYESVRSRVGVLPVASYRTPHFNSRRQVVGAGVSGNAFLFENGVRYDLDSLLVPGPYFHIMEPTDINEAGQIVGWGYNSRGEPRGFLLTPVAEPSLCLLFGLGLACLMVRERVSPYRPPLS